MYFIFFSPKTPTVRFSLKQSLSILIRQHNPRLSFRALLVLEIREFEICRVSTFFTLKIVKIPLLYYA